MNEFKLTLLLHPSIGSTNRILTGLVNGKTRILDGIISILKIDENITNLLVNENEIRPGYLLISEKRELKTTGIINELITTDMDVRIIPISHGG